MFWLVGHPHRSELNSTNSQKRSASFVSRRGLNCLGGRINRKRKALQIVTLLIGVTITATAVTDITNNSAARRPDLQSSPPSPRPVDVKSSDGAILKATFYAAGKPGPGVLLFHQSVKSGILWRAGLRPPESILLPLTVAATVKVSESLIVSKGFVMLTRRFNI